MNLWAGRSLFGRVFHGKYALLDRQSRGLYTVLEMKFSEDTFEMILYGVLRNVQSRADFFIGEPRRQKLKHLFLSFREVIDRRRFGMF